MSDTPSPLPSSEAPKPKLSLAPKAPTAAEPAAPAEASTAPTSAPAHVTPPIQQSNSNVMPPKLAAASNAPRASLKLQGAVHPANPDKFEAPKFTTPVQVESEDGPSGVVVALSAIAAAAAIAFAVLLFLKNQS